MRKALPVIIALVLILIIGGIFFGKQVYDKYSYSDEQVDMEDFYKVSGDKCAIIYGNEQIEEYAKIKNEAAYLDLDTVHKYLNTTFYYDWVEEKLLYTDGAGTVSVSKGQTNPEACFVENNVCYVSMDYVKKFTNFSYERFGNHLEMETEFLDYQGATVESDTQIRLRGGVKSPILRELAEGETVEILEPMENWCKIKTSDAIIGYVELSKLSDTSVMKKMAPTNYTFVPFASNMLDGKVCLGWHSIAGVGGNTTLENVVAEAKSMNVIAPTWFSLCDEAGGFRNFGETSYVTRAHNMGYQVWAVLDDFNYANENGISISVHTVLGSTSLRTRLIGDVVAAAVNLGVDGINIDFEKLTADCGEDFAQFIRELSVECHLAGLTLSVDNYVPFHFNEYYRLDVQGLAADYVIIMGYDEHWHGSGEPGSVASLNYVKNGIDKTLEKVPAQKVVNGLPFYTIVWTTEGAKVTDEYLTLNNTADFLARINKSTVWDEAAGQNYLEWTSGTKTYQVWLEDVDSIQTKLNAMSNKNIGGVAVWRLGYGNKEVWEVISLYMNM